MSLVKDKKDKMKKEDRIKGIEEIKSDPINKTKEVRLIEYNGEQKAYHVYNVPLKYLIYNLLNGRIRSMTKSYETRFGKLDASNSEDALVIEKYLFDSAKGKNEKTLESIEQIGQKESGIITKDGVVIDGNRRSMLLRMINRKNNSDLTFKAVILDDSLENNQKEIMTLETSYQMGVDSKVDYNPIEKYIRCSELENYYSISEIASIMGEEERQIVIWLEILKLMEEYLTHVGTPELYTRLDKREGHFVDLIKYIKTFKRGNQQNVDWTYTEDDIIDLKNAYFTFIRLGIPVQKARIIGRPSSSSSFFCHKDIWAEFNSDLTALNNEIKEFEFENLKNERKDESNEDIIQLIDNNWKAQVETELINILDYNSYLLGDLKTNLEPLRLLKKAKSSLSQIDENVLKENIDSKTISIIGDISKKIKEIEGWV